MEATPQIGVFGNVAYSIVYWIYVYFVIPDRNPSYEFVLFYGLASVFFYTCLWVTYGALLFDMIPSNLMGTLASGFGLISAAMGAILMNTCGWFVKLCSQAFYAPHKLDATKYDYGSVLVFQALCAILAVFMFQYFVRRYTSGRIGEYGKLEAQEAAAKAQ